MKKNIFIALLLVLSVCCLNTVAQDFNLVPQPKTLSQQKGSVSLQKLGTIYYENGTKLQAELLSELLQRVTNVELELSAASKEVKKGVVVMVDSKLDSASYTLNIDKNKVQLAAGSSKALSQAVSTIVQLVDGSGKSASLPLVAITDKPDFQWRAVMLDLARRWHPMESIKEIVELLHYYKIDKLQFHLTDNEAFTFGTELFPRLLSNNPDGTPRYYTKDEWRDLIAFADQRGIEVIPEIDVPGHSAFLWREYPELFGAVDSTGKAVSLGAVNMVKESTYVEFEKLLAEVAEVFNNTEYIHLGGDEVWMGAVSKLPEYEDFCKKHNLQVALNGNPNEVYAYFMVRADSMVRRLGRKTIMWEGFPGNGEGRIVVPNDIPILVWNSQYNPPKDLLENGYEIINAMWEPCYMCGAMNYAPEPWEGYKWKYNSFKHWNHLIPDSEIPESIKVSGGQICHWEQQYDEIYPVLKNRVPALSQRWWDYSDSRSYEQYAKGAEPVAEKLDKILRPIVVEVVEGELVSKLSFQNPIKLAMKNKSVQDGEIRYSLLSEWTIPSVDNNVYDKHLVTLGKGAVVSAQLYGKDGRKIGYPTQIRYEQIDPVFHYAAYKEPPMKGWAEMPNFDTLTMVQEGYFGRVDKARHSQIQRGVFYGIEQNGHIDTRPEGLHNPFALKLKGKIKIDQSGKYDFILKNQDGFAEIMIGDNEYKGTTNQFKEQNFSFELKEGVYDIEILYYYRHIQNVLNIKYIDLASGKTMPLTNLLQTLDIE